MSVVGGRNGPGDAHEIRALVQAFATAVEADPYHASTMLCSQEREHFELHSESDMVLPKYPPKAPPIAVSDVVVDGDLASAVIRRPPASIPVRMYFLREGGAWTVCAPVEDIMYPSQADNTRTRRRNDGRIGFSGYDQCHGHRTAVRPAVVVMTAKWHERGTQPMPWAQRLPGETGIA